MIIVQDFKPIRLHEKTPVRNLRTIVDLLIHSGGQLFPKRYYSRLKKSCGGPNLVLGSKLVNIVRMSPLLIQLCVNEIIDIMLRLKFVNIETHEVEQ